MKKYLVPFLLTIVLLPTFIKADNDIISVDWTREIGNDYYQDITKVDNQIYVLTKKSIIKYDMDGNKTTTDLDLCDVGAFSEDSVICYNFSDPSFRDKNQETEYYYYQTEYVYEYDFNGKLIHKAKAWYGSIYKRNQIYYTPSAGLTFDQIGKDDKFYYLFDNGHLVCAICYNGSNYYGLRDFHVRYNEDTDDYGFYDENWKWVSVDMSDISKRISDKSYIYYHLYQKKIPEFIEKHKDLLNMYGIQLESYTDYVTNQDIDLPYQPMIGSSLGDKYYVGYLDEEEQTYKALVYDESIGKDIDIKINGNLFFSVILGDDYFIVLDTSKDTCDGNGCNKVNMKKYNYNGEIMEEDTILSQDDTFMGTSVGYVVDGGFVVVAGNKPKDQAAYTTSLIKFYKPNYQVKTEVIGKGTLKASRKRADYGDMVTFTITPDDGYVVDKIEVIDNDGNIVTYAGNTFTMPKNDVTIKVLFTTNITNPKTGINNHILISIILSLIGISLFIIINIKEIFNIKNHYIK